MTHLALSCAAIACFAAGQCGFAQALGPTVPVLLSGTPGLSGGTVEGFGWATFDGLGRPIILNGILHSGHGRLELWRVDELGYSELWRAGRVSPAGGSSFSGSPVVSTNSNGDLAFASGLEFFSPAGSGKGVFASFEGHAFQIAADRQAAPGFPSGATFQSQNQPLSPTINAGGEVAFLQQVSGGGVPNIENPSVYRATLGNVELVAHSNSPAPGSPDGTTFAIESARIVNGGRVLIGAGLWGTVPVNTKDILIADPGQPLRSIGLRQAMAPGGEGGRFVSVNLGASEENGNFTFGGVLDNHRDGTWESIGGVIFPIAIRGVTRASDGVLLTSPTSGALAGPGLCSVMSTYLDAAGRPGVGVWLAEPGQSLRDVARLGEPAPEVPGYLFQQFSSGGAVPLAVSPNGSVALLATISLDGSLVDVHDGIWAGTPGDLHLVAEERRPFTVAPGDVRVVNTVSFLFDGAFNDKDELIFHLRFTDGTSGIFVTAIPAPSGMLCGLMALVIVGGRRRRSV